MDRKQVLFRVLMGIGGHEYIVYADGDIEGFGEGAIITNFHDALLGMAVERDRHQRSAKGMSSNLLSPAMSRTSDCIGAEHATPE
jgi:hypothetical protein